MAWALRHLSHVPLLGRDLVAALPATCCAPIGDNMNRNLENLKPVLLLLGGEGKLRSTLDTLLVLVHIPHGRTVRIVWRMLRQVRLDRALRHLLYAKVVILLRNGRGPSPFGLFGPWHLTLLLSDAPPKASRMETRRNRRVHCSSRIVRSTVFHLSPLSIWTT